MASVIAFRARHCIIDLTGFAVPANKTQQTVTIDGIYSTIRNLLEKNIIPILKFRANNVTNYATVKNDSASFVFAEPLRITSDDVVSNVASSSQG